MRMIVYFGLDAEIENEREKDKMKQKQEEEKNNNSPTSSSNRFYLTHKRLMLQIMFILTHSLYSTVCMNKLVVFCCPFSLFSLLFIFLHLLCSLNRKKYIHSSFFFLFLFVLLVLLLYSIYIASNIQKSLYVSAPFVRMTTQISSEIC